MNDEIWAIMNTVPPGIADYAWQGMIRELANQRNDPVSLADTKDYILRVLAADACDRVSAPCHRANPKETPVTDRIDIEALKNAVPPGMNPNSWRYYVDQLAASVTDLHHLSQVDLYTLRVLAAAAQIRSAMPQPVDPKPEPDPEWDKAWTDLADAIASRDAERVLFAGRNLEFLRDQVEVEVESEECKFTVRVYIAREIQKTSMLIASDGTHSISDAPAIIEAVQRAVRIAKQRGMTE